MQAALQKQGRATAISSRSFKRHAVENFATYRKSDLGLRFTIGLFMEITHGPTQKSILLEPNNYAKEGRVGSRDSTELYHQAYTHLFAHRIHLHRASILTLAHHVCKARRGFPTFAARKYSTADPGQRETSQLRLHDLARLGSHPVASDCHPRSRCSCNLAITIERPHYLYPPWPSPSGLLPGPPSPPLQALRLYRAPQ